MIDCTNVHCTRFCQTVEVKTMPQSQLPVRETVTDTNTIPQHVPIIPVRVVMLLALVFGILVSNIIICFTCDFSYVILIISALINGH